MINGDCVSAVVQEVHNESYGEHVEMKRKTGKRFPEEPGVKK